MSRSYIEISKVIVVSCFLLLCIALSSDLMFKNNELYYGEWMHFDYIKTAESFPSINSTPPFCWRLLSPFLVYILPLSTEMGFFVITYLSMIGSAVLIFLITKHIFVSSFYPWIGILTYFSLINAVRINAIEFIAVDPLAFAFILLSILSIYKRNNMLFVISTVMGVLTKEIIFIVLPLYFTINYIPRQSHKYYYNLLYKTFIISVPAIVVYIVLRLIIIPEGHYNYFELLNNAVKYRINSFVGAFSTLNKNLFTHQNSYENSLINIYRISFGAIGPILYFFILKFGKIKNTIFRLSPLIILSFLQLFVAGDNERIVAVGFPAYIMCYLFAVQSFIEENRIDVKYFLVYSILNVVSQIFLTKNLYWQTYYSVAFQLILGLVMVAIVYSIKVMSAKSTIKIV